MKRVTYAIVKMNFLTLDDKTIENFQNEVNHKLCFGWKPQGGLIISLNTGESGSNVIAQSICKSEETDGYSRHS